MDKNELIQSLSCPMRRGIAQLLVDLFNKKIKYQPIYISDDGSSIVIHLTDLSLDLRVKLYPDGTFAGRFTYMTDVQVISFDNADTLLHLLYAYLSRFYEIACQSDEYNDQLVMLNLQVELRKQEAPALEAS